MKRLYTPELANAALPLVRAIVADIAKLEERLATLGAAYRRLRESDSPDRLKIDDARRTVAQVAREREECEGELDALFVRLDDPCEGVADFPAELDGEHVYLCWRLGEDSVNHFHAMSESAASRRPLPEPATTTA